MANGQSSVVRKNRSRYLNPSFPLKQECFVPATPKKGATVREAARRTPLLGTFDVAVFGGGPAGACAAVAAARAGKKVILVEQHGFLGGMTTAGGVTVWHKIYGMDLKTPVIGGLAVESIRRLEKWNAIYEYGKGRNYVVCTEYAKFLYDDLAVGSGVQLLLHTMLVDVQRKGDRIEAAFVENKSGRFAIRANVFIDGTGDADLVRRAGLATQFGNLRGACQPPSLCFRLAGQAPDAAPFEKIQAQLFKTPMDYNGQHYPCFLWGVDGVWDKREKMMAGTRVLHVNVASGFDLTRAEVESRYQLRWFLRQVKKVRGWKHARLVATAPQIGTRESHRILAEHQLTRMELLEGWRFDDVIAQGTYPIDIHNPSAPGIIFERLDGTRAEIRGDAKAIESRWDGAPAGAPPRTTPCYQVPFRSLVPKGLANVLAAGRCIGANSDCAGAIRVMINAMQFGEAAGTAAALLRRGADVREVPLRRLQQTLARNGARFLPAGG
jgi:hypothetical protein